MTESETRCIYCQHGQRCPWGCRRPDDSPDMPPSVFEPEWLKAAGRAEADEIAGGMMEWVPGTLSDMVVERIAIDALADAWNNTGRKPVEFQQKLMTIIYAATGVRMTVYSGPHAENWNGKD